MDARGRGPAPAGTAGNLAAPRSPARVAPEPTRPNRRAYRTSVTLKSSVPDGMWIRMVSPGRRPISARPIGDV